MDNTLQQADVLIAARVFASLFTLRNKNRNLIDVLIAAGLLASGFASGHKSRNLTLHDANFTLFREICSDLRHASVR